MNMQAAVTQQEHGQSCDPAPVSTGSGSETSPVRMSQQQPWKDMPRPTHFNVRARPPTFHTDHNVKILLTGGKKVLT